jgi:O-antigen ligase
MEVEMSSYVYRAGGGSASPGSLRLRSSVAPGDSIPVLLRFSFLFFVFSIPFEALNHSLGLGPISFARFAGLALSATSVLYFRKCFSILPRPILFFLAYLAVCVVTGLFNSAIYNSLFVTQLSTWTQLLVFFWIASNLMRDQKFSGQVLLTYAVSVSAFGLAILLNLPGFSQELWTNRIEGARVSAQGINPNFLGIVLAIASIILMGMTSFKRFRRTLLIAPLFITLFMLVQSASRGAVVALIIGISCFFMSLNFVRRKPFVIVIACFGLMGLIFFVMSNADFMKRWTRAEEGDSAGRDHIMRNSLAMLSERPLLGWGPVEYSGELMIRDKGYLDPESGMQTPHNLVMEVFLQVGIIGAIPFFFAIGYCGLIAWNGRRGELGILPFALLVSLFIGNQFHSFITSKPMWLVLSACTTASTLAASQSNLRRKLRQPVSSSIGFASNAYSDGRSTRFIPR